MAKITPEKPKFLVRPDQIPFGLKGEEREKALEENDRLLDKYAEDFAKYYPELLVKFDSVEEMEKLDNLFWLFYEWLNDDDEPTSTATFEELGFKEGAPESTKEALKEWRRLMTMHQERKAKGMAKERRGTL